MQERLAIRINADNHNHHLWNNHGIWWVHYTLELDGLRARRVRHSLKTRDVSQARVRRDFLLLGSGAPDGQWNFGKETDLKQGATL